MSCLSHRCSVSLSNKSSLSLSLSTTPQRDVYPECVPAILFLKDKWEEEWDGKRRREKTAARYDA